MAEICEGLRCRGTSCAYRSGDHASDGCSYAYITGQTRTAQIYSKYDIRYPTAKQAEAIRKAPCPFYKKGKAGKRLPPIFMPERQDAPQKHDRKKFMELYNKGLTDKELGAALDISGQCAGVLRRSMGLKPNRAGVYRKYDYEKLKELHAQGKTDREIAREMGMKNPKSASMIRLSMGLTANREPVKFVPKSEPTIDYAEVRRLHGEGLNDSEIARSVGCTASSVLRIRQMYALEANRPHRDLAKLADEFLRHYNAGLNDREISEKMGINRASIRRIRQKLELPAARYRSGT